MVYVIISFLFIHVYISLAGSSKFRQEDFSDFYIKVYSIQLLITYYFSFKLESCFYSRGNSNAIIEKVLIPLYNPAQKNMIFCLRQRSRSDLTLFQTSPGFYVSVKSLKTLWEKKKLLVTSFSYKCLWTMARHCESHSLVCETHET